MTVKQVLSTDFSFLHKSDLELEEEFDELFNEQFNEKPNIQESPGFSDGLSPENFHKNSYPNIIPNNSTRVKINSIYGDYINANYCLDKRVIITQGPLEDNKRYDHHHFDFFQMLWENSSSAIYMVTDYVEQESTKCSRYLPPEAEKKILDEFTITCLSDEDVEDNALKDLGIRTSKIWIERKDEETKVLTHYHFPEWGDRQGAAATVVATLARLLLNENRPVVHCSAGIGRSGTLVAAMDAYQKIREGNSSNTLISDVVNSLRRERRGSVQTLAQYQTIYDAVRVLVENDSVDHA